MPDLRRVGHLLALEVIEHPPLSVRHRHAHPHVPVDGGGHHEAAVAAVVGGEVGAATAEGDPQRGTD